jgi:phage terminase large subunit-like protein
MFQEWKFACPDWEDRIRQGRSLMPDRLPLVEKDAKTLLGIFNKLRLPDVPGQPGMKDASGQWYRDIVYALGGSVVDGERMIKELFCLVPKKNSKTSYSAGMMLSVLVDNQRPRAEFLLIGPTKQVADLAFSQAEGMINADPDGFLQKRMHIMRHVKIIEDRKTKATLQIKAFDSSVLTGVKPVGVLVDELHEIAKDSAAIDVIRQIRGGLLPNPEGFLAFITTQSDRPPRGAFRAELAMARAIRDGKTEGDMLPILYEFPMDIQIDEAQWSNPRNWHMVNPNLDRSVTIKALKRLYNQAAERGREELAGWASQHLNVEIGLGLSLDTWIGAQFWQQQADDLLDLDEIIRRSDVVVVGVDGGGLDDLLGLTVLGRDAVTRDWLSWSKAWVNEIVPNERRKSIASKLRDLEADGDLTIINAQFPAQDIFELVAIVKKLHDTGKLAKVGMDPVGVGTIVDELELAGIRNQEDQEELIVGVSQGFKLNGAIKTAERKLYDGSLVHADQELMNWTVANAKTELRGSATVITKAASGVAKIDPLMALFNAVALMSMNPAAPTQSVYDRRGVLTIGRTH